MKRKLLCKALAGLGVAGSLLAFSGAAHAGAFQIWEQNGAGTGDYHAGGAAEANDASTIYYNPAGLTRLHHQQIVVSAVAIPTYARFSGTVTEFNGAQSLTGHAQGGGFTFKNNLVPSFYYALPLDNRMTIGLGFTVPFGLATDYPQDSNAALFATETSMKVMDFMPAFGYRISNRWSVGAGLDIEYMKATFDNYQFDNFKDTNTGSSNGYGWHAGVLFEMSPTTRFGFTYHSTVHFNLHGKSRLHVSNTSSIVSKDLAASTTLPYYAMFSMVHDFSKRWTGLASLTYTRWDVFQRLTLHNVAGASAPLTLQQHFTNTWNLALGAHYKVNQQWLLKAGLGYDKSPVHGVYRNLRLPDQDHYAFAFGVHYQPWKQLGLDAGYAYIYIPTANLHNTSNLGGNTVTTNGHTDGDANIIGLQLTWTLV